MENTAETGRPGIHRGRWARLRSVQGGGGARLPARASPQVAVRGARGGGGRKSAAYALIPGGQVVDL